MIEIRIKEVANDRGIKNAHRLQLAAELSPAAAARFWKTEVEKISMETLDRLCKALECQPGDLFVYTADQPKKSSSNGKAVGVKTAEIGQNGNPETTAKNRKK